MGAGLLPDVRQLPSSVPLLRFLLGAGRRGGGNLLSGCHCVCTVEPLVVGAGSVSSPVDAFVDLSP